MPSIQPNKLIVEGKDDCHSIINLMRHHVNWPNDKTKWPVELMIADGIDNILNEAAFGVYLKASDTKNIGFVIDADESASRRWENFRSVAVKYFPNLPTLLPESGLIERTSGEINLGCWIMPNCDSSGMLETFLKYMIPKEDNDIWKHAVSSLQQALALGANCGSALEKAQIHTWLAWQDPPGQTYGLALRSKTFDPGSPAAFKFIAWFKDLFGIP